MKKTLLSLAIIFMAIISVNSQTVWNLGGDEALNATSPAFPTSTGIGIGDGTAGNPAFPVMINGLGITGISTNANMGAVNASAKTFGSYSFVNRFQFNGAGYTGAAAGDATPLVNMPTQRFLTFNVSGNSTVYMIGITGSSSSERKVFVTDGTNYVGSVTFPAASALSDGTINYTGGATTLYVFCNASCNLALLSATNVVASSVPSILSDKGITFNGSEITNTKGLEIEVYNALGKRITSSISSIPTNNFQKGMYIVRIAGTSDVLKIMI